MAIVNSFFLLLAQMRDVIACYSTKLSIVYFMEIEEGIGRDWKEYGRLRSEEISHQDVS